MSLNLTTDQPDRERTGGSEPGGRRERTQAKVIKLGREECLELLAAHQFGRVVVVMHNGAPVIRPVNYAFDQSSQSVVFRTARGSKFHALLHATKAAFEIDGIDEASRTGWSVIVEGVAEEVRLGTDIRHLTGLTLEPWAPGPKPHWLHIRVGTVSGRRIVLPHARMPAYYLG